MIRRFLLAAPRCAAMVVLSLLGFAAAGLAVIAGTTVLAYPAAARGLRRLAAWHRGLAWRWAGVEIEAPAMPPRPVPHRRSDGWYVYDNQAYRSARVPTFLMEMKAITDDKGFLRIWYWLGLAPFVGGLVALVPVALIGFGAASVFVDLTPIWLAPPLILAGVGVAPVALRLQAAWTKAFLQPAQLSWWNRSGIGGWVGPRSAATWHGGGLAGLSGAAFGGFLVNLIAAVASWALLIPMASLFTRHGVVYYRQVVGRWAGVEIEEPYRPYPSPPVLDADGTYRVGRALHTDRARAVRGQRMGWVLGDPATWRDIAWMGTAWIPSLVGLIPSILVGFGSFGLVWQVVWWAPWAIPVGLFTGTWVTPWYMWSGVRYLIPGAAIVPDWASLLVGLLLTVIGLLLAKPLLGLRIRYDRLLLAPTRAARLARRVERLTETRADAADAQAAELRRIERDLHDGAQARLIAVGLSLSTVERLLATDPDRAMVVLAQAREASSTALTELRQLVRGIHPPVLSERGLIDAVRAIALDSPLPVQVSAELPGRPPAPVESAAYFAICEALANVSRHAAASHVDIAIGYADGLLELVVTDDGHGGADPARGTGLTGMRRRLATFDGVLSVHSPGGGPTEVRMEIPCVLSWPKTSTC